MSVENGGRLKKLKKKCAKGEIFTLDNYFECKQHGIQAVPVIVFSAEQSRSYAKYDLHLSELRALLLSITMDKPIPKYFQMKNKPFIRSLVLLHVSDCPDIQSIAAGIDSGPVIKTKVNRSNDNDVTYLPLKLFTIARDEAELFENALNSTYNVNAGPSNRKPVSKAVSSGRHDNVKNLSPYVLAPSQMKLWGYPLRKNSRKTDSITACDDHTSDEPASKKLKTEDVASAGVFVGIVPSQQEAEQVLLSLGMPTITASESDINEFEAETVPSSALPTSHPLSIAAIDCEMVESAPGVPEIARVTLIDQDCAVVLDVLVKPPRKITNYLTVYSGITEKMLENVTTTLSQVQLSLLRLVSSDTILVGHSLDSDLRALRLTHDRCVDTSILYPHPRGFPLRYKLKQLASDYLKIKIQEGSAGHDSAEDARAALRLALLKADNGPLFGLNRRQEGRIPLSKYWKSEETRVLLSCQAHIHELSHSKSSSDAVTSLVDDGSVVSDADHASTVTMESVLSYPYCLDSVIAGDMTASLTSTAQESVAAAVSFLQAGKSESVTYQQSEDKVNVVMVAIKFTTVEDLCTHIAAIETAVQESGNHGLILTTLQKTFSEALKLKKHKKTCLNNLMSSVVWSKESEMKLQQEVEECNQVGLMMKIV